MESQIEALSRSVCGGWDRGFLESILEQIGRGRKLSASKSGEPSARCSLATMSLVRRCMIGGLTHMLLSTLTTPSVLLSIMRVLGTSASCQKILLRVRFPIIAPTPR